MTLKIQIPDHSTNSNLFSPEFLNEKFHQFKNIIDSEQYGFFRTIDNQSLVDECKAIYDKHKTRVKTFVQIGIGGSSLGPEMLISALKRSDVNFIFINNIDPDHLHEQLSEINDIDTTLFYFVSKSGGTAETMAALAIITHFLQEKGISQSRLKELFIFCTDPQKSDLLNLGKELGIECTSVPTNVGGRFSVLTPVGFLSALFADIDIEKLLAGAQEMAKSILNDPIENNILLHTASYIYQLKEQGVTQTVLMPYSSKLRDLSFWFVQLWAESLGKAKNRNGEIVNTGLTPIPSYGATDQHSQMQLFMEGPFDKLLFMLEIDHFTHDYSLENDFATPALKKLSHYTLTQLMKAELNGTLMALKEANRPFIHLTINQNDEYNLGAIILFFESLTALMGEYLNIDPFNQPGVEAGKKYAFEWLEEKR